MSIFSMDLLRELYWHGGSLGTPGPDFPSGLGESQHMGRLTTDYAMQNISSEAQQAMGLAKLSSNKKGISKGEQKILERANEILGFA